MSDEGSSINRTQVTVAVIGLLSAITVAVIANADKLFGHADPAPRSQPADPQQAGAVKAMTATTLPPAAIPDISGRWYDNDGYSYVIAQSGTAYSYRQSRAGTDQGGAVGEISGHRLRHRFTTAEDQGDCEGTLSDDETLVSGTCTVGGKPWPFSIRRGARQAAGGVSG